MKFPKHQYVRSPALMKAYRSIPCQHCGKDDGTVCGAHSNLQRHHKGRGIKADDSMCASLCFTCHTALDQGRHMTKEEKDELWWTAWRKTVDRLVKAGLWPMNVEIPDIRRFN